MLTETQRQQLQGLVESRETILVNNLLWELEKEVQKAHQGLHSKERTLTLLKNPLLQHTWNLEPDARERLKALVLAIIAAPFDKLIVAGDIPNSLESGISKREMELAKLRNPSRANSDANLSLSSMSKMGVGPKALKTWWGNPQSTLISLEDPNAVKTWHSNAGQAGATYTFEKLRAALKPLENLKGTATFRDEDGEGTPGEFEIEHPGIATLVDFLDKTLSGGPLVVAGSGRNMRFRAPFGILGGWMEKYKLLDDSYELDYPVLVGPERLMNDPSKYSDQKGHPGDIQDLVRTVKYHSQYEQD